MKIRRLLTLNRKAIRFASGILLSKGSGTAMTRTVLHHLARRQQSL